MTLGSSLTQKTGKSALWQLAGGGWQAIMRLGASVFLARALPPSAFGIMGMAILVHMFLTNIGAAGMGSGIIAKKDVTDEDLCTCFWSMAAMRTFAFLIAFWGAPLFAYFFNEPRLTEVIQVVSVTFLISILGAISQTILTKELKFQSINIIRGIASFLESIVAVFLAITTALGYWALVIGMIVHSAVNHLLLFYWASWRPKFVFKKNSFFYLIRYGIYGLGSSIMAYLRQNLDYLVVGRLLGSHVLGLYEFAYRIPHLVHERISKPIGMVVFPAISKVQDNNKRIENGYIQSVKYLSLITFPMLFGLAAIADVAVPVLWGDQWLPIITPLRLLCICAALRVVPQPLGAVFKSKNRPDLPFKIAAVALIWTATVVGLCGYYYGLIGVAFGMLLSVMPGYISVWIAFRMIDAKIRYLVVSLLPVLISAMCSGMSALGLSYIMQIHGITNVLILPSSIIIGAIVYILVLFWIFQNEGKEIVNIGYQVIK